MRRTIWRSILFILPVVVVGIAIFYFVGMQYLAPVETVNGVVIDVLFEHGVGEDDHEYTRVVVSDAQTVVWVLQCGGYVPFEIGDTYTFEVRKWPCGSFSGPLVTQTTTVYPIADYSPRISPASTDPLFIVFALIGVAIVAIPFLRRYLPTLIRYLSMYRESRRNRGG